MKMKIAYIIPPKKTNQNREAEKNARELALKLEEKGHSASFHTSFLSVLWQNFDIIHFTSGKAKLPIFLIKILKRKAAIATAPIPAGINMTHAKNYNHIKERGLLKGSYILSVGRLTKNRGALFLAETFKRLEDKHLAREKKLILVGKGRSSGEYAKELKDSIRGRENILLFETLPGEVLRQLLSHCYLFVEPSENKKTPRELLEAMSCGAAVLASGTKENLRLLGKEAGFSFRPGDSYDAENKISLLINSPLALRKVKEKAQEIAERKYSLNRIVSHMENIYTEEFLQKREKIIFKTYEKNI